MGGEGANKVHFRRCASGVLLGVPPGGLTYSSFFSSTRFQGVDKVFNR